LSAFALIGSTIVIVPALPESIIRAAGMRAQRNHLQRHHLQRDHLIA